MKFNALVSLDIPEADVDAILALAGVPIVEEADKAMAILAAAARQLPTVLREYLLAPEHVAPEFGIPIQFSENTSPTQVFVTLIKDEE